MIKKRRTNLFSHILQLNVPVKRIIEGQFEEEKRIIYYIRQIMQDMKCHSNYKLKRTVENRGEFPIL